MPVCLVPLCLWLCKRSWVLTWSPPIIMTVQNNYIGGTHEWSSSNACPWEAINSYVLPPPHPQWTDPSPSLPLLYYYAPPHHAHSHPVFSFVIVNSRVDSFLPVESTQILAFLFGSRSSKTKSGTPTSAVRSRSRTNSTTWTSYGSEVPKRRVESLRIGFRKFPNQIARSSTLTFRFGREQIVEVELPTFDLAAEVPERIVKF